jgi:cytochrome c5
MIMNSKRILLFSALLSASVALAQATTQSQPPSKQPVKTHVTAPNGPQHEDDGSRIFRQNCSRCHNTPEGFSPRISGTVLRHMTVRAFLSMRDKAELMRFLNP